MPRPVPQAGITFNPETGLFGFEVWFEGRRPHVAMSTFRSEEAARAWIDPQEERIWEKAAPDSGYVKISKGFKPGTVGGNSCK